MASSANIPILPLELWREISSHLPNRDIKCMRLASKRFPVEPWLQRVFLSPNPLNIKVLRAIADHEKFRLGVTEIIWDDARLSRGPREHNGLPGGESDISDAETEESFLAIHRAGQDWAPDWRVEWNFHDSESESNDDDGDNEDENDDEDMDYVDDNLDVVRKSENFKKQN